MPGEIAPEDSVSRCIIWDKAFSGTLHLDEFLFVFGSRGEDGGAHESGVLRSLASADDDVHRIGCGIAAAQNDRLGDPARGPRRRYYCGFRTARVADIPTTADRYKIVLRNIEEYGEKAHVDIALYVNADEGRNARSTLRTAAGLALAEAFGAPVIHVCDCDAEDSEQPVNKWGPDCLTSGLKDRFLNPGPNHSGAIVEGSS